MGLKPNLAKIIPTKYLFAPLSTNLGFWVIGCEKRNYTLTYLMEMGSMSIKCDWLIWSHGWG